MGKDVPRVGPMVEPGVLPPPRTTDLGNRIRLPFLGDDPGDGCGDSSTTPRPTEKDIAEFNKYIDSVVDPRNVLDLIAGRPRLIILKDTPTRTQMGDPSIAQFELIRPTEMSILGLEVGTTVFNLWFRDPENPGKEKILSYLVRVIPDPTTKTRLERVYQELAKEINRNFPDSYVEISLVGDKVVIRGQAKDIVEATQILRIVRANAPTEESVQAPVENVSVVVQPTDLPGGTPSLREFLLAGGPNVINLLKVPGEHQVTLKVVVAEVNRSAARSIGINFSVTNNAGVTVFAQQTGNIASGGAAGVGGFGGAGGAGLGAITNNLPINLDGGQVSIALNALRNLSYARFLAEPNLTALNGQPATFQAGGQFPVPVVTGFTASGLQGVSFVPFGVQLQFTPFITDKDRIRLQVAADVSVRDTGSGTQIQGANVSGLQTRNFTTVVELREGQTLAVAGLIQNNIGAEATRVPFLGDLPLIGRLGAFDKFSSSEQELVILITPELVHPLEHKEVPGLPGSDVFEPGDVEFYLLGRLESRRSYDNRSPVRTDIHRMLRYRRCEDQFIYGPTGYAGPPAPVEVHP